MNKKEHDANWWKERRARLQLPEPQPLLDPCVLPSENLADYERLVAEYYARFAPTRPEERGFIDDIVYCEWILRRLARTESELIRYAHNEASTPHPDYPLGQPAAQKPKLFTALEWRAISTRKALQDALEGLRDLRRHPVPDSLPDPVSASPTIDGPLPETGFVPETSSTQPLPPAHDTLSVARDEQIRT